MNRKLNITVMLGGPSAEREVSLRSGAGVVKALRSLGHTIFEIDPETPEWVLPPGTDIVCLAPLHGTYGEDGQVQEQLEQLGMPYTGCDSESSRLAFDKVATKKRCIEAGVPTADFGVVGAVSERVSTAAGCQTNPAGFERRLAICRKHRRLAEGIGRSVEV